jgi:dTMP kinase
MDKNGKKRYLARGRALGSDGVASPRFRGQKGKRCKKFAPHEISAIRFCSQTCFFTVMALTMQQQQHQRGLFVVIEGPDGVGKSTQIEACSEVLKSMHGRQSIVATREPTNAVWSGMEGERKMENRSVEWFTDRFITDRKRHIADVIMPAIESGKHVICDRYYYSTLCYQGAQGGDMQKLIQHALESVRPDLTIVLMCARETRAARRGKRGTAEDVFERDHELQERVTENYGRLGSLLPESENIVYVDASDSAEAVMDRILHEIDIAKRMNE